MANETIGKLPHHCGHDADVRKDRNGKLYLQCPNCGQLKYNLSGGQDYILDNAVMFNERGEVPEVDDKKPVNVTGKTRFETEKKTVNKKPVEKPLTEKPVIQKPVDDSGIGNMSL